MALKIREDDADEVIGSCLRIGKPKSFFLYAGAGSGKTRSLVNALINIREEFGQHLRYRGQRVAVITYTNAARDEILRRVDYDPVVTVSTIHSFVWELIKGFDWDIREWLRTHLVAEISELQALLKKGRAGTKAAVERERSIVAKSVRLESLPFIKRFIYSPTGDNRTRDSLNHSEVIEIGSAFLREKLLMRQLLFSGTPIVLIDEAQDTNKHLMEAMLVVQKEHHEHFAVGLFGDTMQRIYADGKVDLGESLPPDWLTPRKLINHRCPKRVIKLINAIRSAVDDHQQSPSDEAAEGVVRLFVAPNEGIDKVISEDAVRREMALLTNDPLWDDKTAVKTLTLEHHMAARRMGFLGMFAPLDRVSEFTTGLRNGELPLLRFFADLIMPIVSAQNSGNTFAVAAIARKHSPLLERDSLIAAGAKQADQIERARVALKELVGVCEASRQASFSAVLECVARTKLFEIPEVLYPFVQENNSAASEDSDEDESTRSTSIREFLDSPFSQIAAYSAYIKGSAEFGTHQGVKGLEFPRVLVIADDNDARGFMFSFEKLFGVAERSTTDLSNEESGKETSIDRTRRLLFVTCSRSEKSLAIISYSASPERLKKFVTERGWFSATEVQEVPVQRR